MPPSFSSPDYASIFGKPLRSEAALLLSCASTGESPLVAGTHDILNSGLDWDLALRLARAQGMIPLLYRFLNPARAALVPEPVMRNLRMSFHANAMRNRMMIGELLRILARFESGGIAALTFKGPVLALLAHGDAAMRQIADLDILVRYADAGRATEALIAEGYIPRINQSEALRAGFSQTSEDVFESPNGTAPIDLHWRLTPRYFPFAPSPDSLWPRAINFMLDGHPVPALSVGDLMLFLCVHSAKHGWPVLGNIADIAFLARAQPQLDWSRIYDEAFRLKCRRMLLLGAHLAGNLLAAPVPADLLHLARRDKPVMSLARRVLRNLFTSSGDSDARGVAGWSIPLRSIESVSGRVNYLLDRALAPTIEDWEFMAMPPPLFPLYYALRPARLALQNAARLIGRGARAAEN
ncbi:MAG: nucleotidyltransferase domain-containing protein [Candidatus Binataceae bacterium]